MEHIETNERSALTIRPSSDLHSRIADAAGWLGLSLNSFILEAAAERADEIIEHRQSVKLSPDDAIMILKLLDSPGKPNEALKLAFENRKRLFRA